LEKKRRERGATLEAEQRGFIDAKLHEEGLSIKAGATKYQIAERTLRNALNGKPQDYTTLEEIIYRLGVPDVNKIQERHRRLFHIPRERNLYFTGREERMGSLQQALAQSRFAAVTQALSGLGGIGKTSTAIEYAYRCLDKANYPDYPHYKTIQFVRADTVEVLKNGYLSIANALELRRADPNNLDQAVQAVLRWMIQSENTPWLVILDNVDDLHILKEFLPTEPQRHHGHVLITSRSHSFTHQIKRVIIEEMNEEEGVKFLYRRTGRDGERIAGSKEEHAAQALVSELGGLPLALEQAAAYMVNEQEMPFGDYLINFQDQAARSKLMRYAPEAGLYRQFEPGTRQYLEAMTVLTTWHMSLAKIELHHPEAVQLLQLCAFLHPVGIPRELVIALLTEFFASAMEDATQQNKLYNGLLTVLMRYSLILRDLEHATHSVHVLVQTVLRDELSSAEQRGTYERILGAITSSFPSEDYVVGGRGALYYPHAERIFNYTKQVGLENKVVALLLTQMGNFMDSQGRFTEAASLYTQALSMQQKVLSAEHLDIATSLTYLSELYRKQRRFSEAELLCQRALEMRRKTLSSDHPDIASILNNMALLRWEQRRVSEAKNLLEQALAMWRKLQPLDNIGMAKGLGNLAIMYQHEGHLEEAEAFLTEGLALLQAALPENHPEIASGLHNLALLYIRQNRFAEAENLNLQALDIRRKSLFRGHPDIAMSITNLGVLYRRQGRIAEAERRLGEVLAMWEEAFPEGHPEIGTCLNNLAMIHDSQDRFAEAEPLYLQGLAMWRKTLPADHPDIAASLNHVASAYQKHGRLAEAELLRKEAAEILQSELDTKHTV
jgi:tetratricopeptide (TPR) repeat protein/lambda repressor-like predicted transcriptional regulator